MHTDPDPQLICTILNGTTHTQRNNGTLSRKGTGTVPVSDREVAGYGVSEVAGAGRLVRTGRHNGAARLSLHIRFIPTSHLKDFFH